MSAIVPFYRAPRRRRMATRRRRAPIRRKFARVPRSVRAYRGEHVIRKLRYALNLGASHSVSSSSGAIGTDYIYRANDLYDVYALTGGHQPRCFDQLMAMYRNFAVLGSKITVDVGFGQGSATSFDMLAFIVMNDTVTSITNVGATRENPRLTYKYVTTNKDQCRLVKKYSYKVNGVRDVLDESQLWGTSSASPERQWYYHVSAYQPDGDSESVYITGIIEFTAIFFNAVQPPQS